jgi:prepilin-type N-terminal cleavage/methylation domain-containing protein
MPGRVHSRSSPRAFTILEIMIVIVLALVLAAIAWPTFMQRSPWGIREARSRIAASVVLARAQADSDSRVIELWAEGRSPVRLVLRTAVPDGHPVQRGHAPALAELPIGVWIRDESGSAPDVEHNNAGVESGIRLVSCSPGGMCTSVGRWFLTDGERDLAPRVNVWTGVVEFESTDTPNNTSSNDPEESEATQTPRFENQE